MSAAALAVLRPARVAGQDLASGIFASQLALASGLSRLEPANDTGELRVAPGEVASESCHRLVKDQVGSVRMVVDVETGAVVRRIDFDSFGRVLSATGDVDAVPFGFAGGLWEPATGLVRFGFRDYDPGTGRFTLKDPIRFDGGVNLYAYANNDPVNFVDLTGRNPAGALAGGATTGVLVGGVGLLAGVLISAIIDELTDEDAPTVPASVCSQYTTIVDYYACCRRECRYFDDDVDPPVCEDLPTNDDGYRPKPDVPMTESERGRQCFSTCIDGWG